MKLATVRNHIAAAALVGSSIAPQANRVVRLAELGQADVKATAAAGTGAVGLLGWLKSCRNSAKAAVAAKPPITTSQTLTRLELENLERFSANRSAVLARPRFGVIAPAEEGAGRTYILRNEGGAVLLDSAGRPVITPSFESLVAREVYEMEAQSILVEAIRKVPAEKLKSTVELRKAIRSAVESKQKTSYAFDASTGELTLKRELLGGEHSFKVNVYKAGAAMAATYYGHDLPRVKRVLSALQEPETLLQKPGGGHGKDTAPVSPAASLPTESEKPSEATEPTKAPGSH